MSNEKGGKDDYFGIDSDHGNAPATPSPADASGGLGSANTSGTVGTTATTGTTAGTETENRTQTPPRNNNNDSQRRRGHNNDSKRAARNQKDSSRRAKRGEGGHKDSGREHRDKDTDDRGGHTPKELKPPAGTTTSVMDDLEEMECYHGNILEDEVKGVLNKHGDYMLRMTVGPEGGKGIFVTIIQNEDVVNLPIRAKYFETEGGKEYLYTIDCRTRSPHIKDLIRKHTAMAIPVIKDKREVWLLNPIAKQSWELRPENVDLIKKLGEGAFGEVYSGKLRLPLKKFCNVAIKVIKRCANTENATMELQKEAAIMRKLKHINIVRFYGMVVKKDTIMVVMELINGGALDKYLKKFPNTDSEERTAFAAHIATGLAYLHQQGVMHRDIACRNCLLDMQRKLAKVSDFGLARAAKEYKLRAEERIPIRWTAPEVVKTYIYTQKADIYAYAILVYEIFSNAALPFEGYSNAQIKDQIHNDEFRPKFPEGTPPVILEVIPKCWIGDPAKRTGLNVVAQDLNAVIPRNPEWEPRGGGGGGSGTAVQRSKENLGRGGGGGNMSREKVSKAKKPASQRSKERGGGKGKSREYVKSIKSGRTKREERKVTSRERAE